MMKRLLVALGLLACMTAPSWAVCAVTNLQVKDNAAVTAAVPYADDGSGASNCSPQLQIKQGGHVANVDANNGLLIDPALASLWGLGNTGSAVPGAAAYMAMNVGGNLTGLTGTANGLKVDGTVTNWAGAALGAMANFGTSPGAVLVPGGNSFVFTNNGGTPLAWPAKAANTVSSSDVVPEVAVANAIASVTPGNGVAASPVDLQSGSNWANKANFLSCMVTLTTTGATTCTGMGAQGIGVKIYVTDGYCTRNDVGTTAISVTTDVLDSSGTNNVAFDLPNLGGGGGFEKQGGGTPWVVAANTAFTLNISANTTSVKCNFNGYKGS